MSGRGNVRRGTIRRGSLQLGICPSCQCKVGEMFGRGNAWSGNCLVGDLSVGELSVREMSVGHLSSGKCPVGEMSWYQIFRIYTVKLPIIRTPKVENLFFELLIVRVIKN